MAHGQHCHCMMCTVGKKMGIIHKEHNHPVEAEDKSSAEVCKACGHEHKAGGSCDCGCK